MSVARWLQDHPGWLEGAYRLTAALIRGAEPLLRGMGFSRLEGLFEWGERVSKGWLFDCRMCGICNLRGTGMTCPMTCPKQMRNGPCGGVRPDGKCEVLPEQDCIWVHGWQRSERMPVYGKRIFKIHPPVDHRLKDTSAWLNMLDRRDQVAPPDWVELPAPLSEIPFLTDQRGKGTS